MATKKRKVSGSQLALNIFFSLFALLFILPMILVVSISFSSEYSVINLTGFSLIPQEFSVEAYKLAFRNPASIANGYKITAASAFLGTFLSCLVAGMAAYPLSRSNFRFKTPVTWIIFFTMLFGAGMIPTYIVFTKYYGLGDTFWIYILPGIMGGAWNTMMYRTFFKSLPESLFESAKLDGARELTIFIRIVVPLSTPIFATLGFMGLVGKWNDYMTSMVYIRKNELFTLQYLLQKILMETEYLRSLMSGTAQGASGQSFSVDASTVVLPAETMKYAMCVIAAGPMLLVFPFFQKYFSQGLTVGAVKG